MPKRRKKGNKFTTISISWEDKEVLRRYAEFKKETKNGELFESDSEVFHKLLELYRTSVPVKHINGTSTYPTILRDESQQGSSP